MHGKFPSSLISSYAKQVEAQGDPEFMTIPTKEK